MANGSIEYASTIQWLPQGNDEPELESDDY